MFSLAELAAWLTRAAFWSIEEVEREMQVRKYIGRNNYISAIPVIITSVSILLGIFNGLSSSSNKELSDSILDILVHIGLFDKINIGNSQHNLYFYFLQA